VKKNGPATRWSHPAHAAESFICYARPKLLPAPGYRYHSVLHVGFLTCLNDILIPHLKSIFELSYAKAMLIQFAFFSAYFLFSVPWSRVVNTIGYKTQQDMSTHLREEVTLNVNLLMGAMNAINHVNARTFGFVPEDLHNAGLVLVEQLNSDRFDLYFTDHKLSVYEQTGHRELIRFYKLIGGILSVVEHRCWISLRPTIHEAIEKGRKYFADQGIDFVREQTPIDLFFGLDLAGNKVTPA
jgi:hypothetical protein